MFYTHSLLRAVCLDLLLFGQGGGTTVGPSAETKQPVSLALWEMELRGNHSTLGLREAWVQFLAHYL